MDAVTHPVRFQRASDLGDDRLVRGDLREGERLGGASQPVQVLDELEDPALVQPQPLPHGVPALDGAVERADAGLVAVQELAAHVDDQVPVALVELLQHSVLLSSTVG